MSGCMVRVYIECAGRICGIYSSCTCENPVGESPVEDETPAELAAEATEEAEEVVLLEEELPKELLK